ncbi:MAG: hypothetical protein EHM41_13105, partial [Chloroflexi bacterium]
MKTRSRILYAALLIQLVLSFSLLAPSQVAGAATIYRVIPAGKTSGECGDTWLNGCALQYALTTKAVTGDELWVKMGTYKPTGNEPEPRVNSIVLKAGVSLYGGFAGTETERTQRNWQANPTILSGDLNGDDGPNFGNIADNSFHVVKSNSVGSLTILDGFTIRGGNATSVNTQQRLGGGMYSLSSCPTLTNIQFYSNAAQNDGGGLYAACNNTPVFTNLTFSGNRAGRKGGGLYNDYYDQPGQIIINYAVFADNFAVGGGGGMYEDQAYSTLTNVRFIHNSANFAGGIIIDINFGGSSKLTNVIFDGNTATDIGGGIYVYGSSPNLTNVIFTNNTANDYNYSGGGGMGNYDSRPVLTNVTFSDNNASRGGAIYNFGSPSVGSHSVIRNSLLWGDTGGELFNVNSDSGTLISYSIVQGCTPGGIWNLDCGTDGGYNLADENPLFIDAANGDLHLRSDSPALNQGYLGYLIGVFTDLDGNPRFIGGIPDLGAYEYQNNPPQVMDFSKNGPSDQEIIFNPVDFSSQFM